MINKIIITAFMLFCINSIAQHQTVKALKYYEDGLFIDLSVENKNHTFIVLEMNHSFSKTKSKYLNIQGEKMKIIKAFRVRKQNNLMSNYILEYYESISGKRIIYLIPIPNNIKFKI